MCSTEDKGHQVPATSLKSDGQKQDVFCLSPLNSLGVTTQIFLQGCCVNYEHPQVSMAFGQGLSESLTVPGLFGVLWPWILEDSRSCPRQTPHLTHEEDTETQKDSSLSPPASRRICWKNIFCASTWNTAFKTQEKDLFRKLGDVSNTAHTLALLWQPFPPAKNIRLHSSAAKYLHVSSQYRAPIWTKIVEEIIRTNV